MLLNLPWQIFLSMHLLSIFLALIKCACRLEIAFGLHLNLLRRYIIADFLSLGTHACKHIHNKIFKKIQNRNLTNVPPIRHLYQSGSNIDKWCERF